ncbi:MAG: MFS transporter [Oscillospiraceae bacterium]|nr:MFS transporter [Oscillospiraceae bacterium]
MAAGALKEKISEYAAFWHTPPKGYYVPYKEVAAFTVGKFGWVWACLLVAEIGLGVTNRIIAIGLNVQANHIQIMSILCTFISFFFTLYRSQLIDNPVDPKRRFSHYIKYMGYPTVTCALVLVWFPYSALPGGGESGAGYFLKCAVVFLCVIGIQYFYPLYSLANGNLIMIISPNTQERQNIQAISQTLYSVSWSISRPIITLIAGTLYKDSGMEYNLNLYRIWYIPFMVIGIACYYMLYYSVKERVIQAEKTAEEQKLKIRETIRAVGKNKNFWLLCAASWAGFLEGNSNDIIQHSFNFQNFGMPKEGNNLKATGLKALIDTINAEAALPAMLLSPLFVKLFGKRLIMIIVNFANIGLLGITYKYFRKIPILVTFSFINAFFNQLQGVISPNVDADIRDEQHYMTGERIDGMFGVVGYFGSLISMGTGFVTPALQKRAGIYDGNGAVDPATGKKSAWWILAQDEVFDRYCRIMIVASVIGAAANAIPYLFYDLTEKKQRAMMRVLKLRALKTDYADGKYTPKQLTEGVEIVRQARINALGEVLPMEKGLSLRERAERKAHNEDLTTVDIILKELPALGEDTLAQWEEEYETAVALVAAQEKEEETRIAAEKAAREAEKAERMAGRK